MVENEIARIRAEMSEEQKWITEELAHLFALLFIRINFQIFSKPSTFVFPHIVEQFSTFPLPSIPRDNSFENSSEKKFFSKNFKVKIPLVLYAYLVSFRRAFRTIKTIKHTHKKKRLQTFYRNEKRRRTKGRTLFRSFYLERNKSYIAKFR